MKALQKNQGRTDQMLGAMADILTSLAIPSQQWLTEGGEGETPAREAPIQGPWGPVGLDWDQDPPEVSGRRERTDSYSAGGSEGSLSTSVASLPPGASASSAPSSPGSRRSVSTLKKWLTNPVRKLSAGATKGERPGVGKPPAASPRSHSQDLGSPPGATHQLTILPLAHRDLELREGLASPEDLSPATLHSPSFVTDSLMGCTSLPLTQDTESTNAAPDDSSSALMDDTSSQSSEAACTEEDRRSALEKSMYAFSPPKTPRLKPH